MRLPGGLLDAAGLTSRVRLKEVTGLAERAVLEPGGEASVPERVTAALTLAVDRIGAEPCTPAVARALSSGDRRWLLRQVLARMGLGAGWRTLACAECERPFDVYIDTDELPCPVGADYPSTVVELSLGTVSVRVPTGADEEAAAELADPDAALRALIGRCVTRQGDGGAPEPEGEIVDRMTDEDLDVVDAVIAELGPAPATEVGTACPYCDTAAAIAVDPYAVVGHGDDELVREVHDLALTYRWDEAAILAMPRDRRRAHSALIAREQGVLQ